MKDYSCKGDNPISKSFVLFLSLVLKTKGRKLAMNLFFVLENYVLINNFFQNKVVT